VTNAIKYTPRRGRVEIAMQCRPAAEAEAGSDARQGEGERESEVAITVRDTGIGISANDLPHVFDRFWRADRARSRRIAAPRDAEGANANDRGGFGLGLAIAQWIVQAHGGSINVQSRLGRGSIFTVILPTVRPAGGPAERPDAAASAMEHAEQQTETRDHNSDFTNS
jgi:signal transduction histidine kinase